MRMMMMVIVIVMMTMAMMMMMMMMMTMMTMMVVLHLVWWPTTNFRQKCPIFDQNAPLTLAFNERLWKSKKLGNQQVILSHEPRGADKGRAKPRQPRQGFIASVPIFYSIMSIAPIKLIDTKPKYANKSHANFCVYHCIPGSL